MERIGRGTLSVALIVVATVLAVAGGVALYARQEIVEPHAFAERAQNALERDAVRQVVAREIVVQLIDRGSTDLISARPVIEEVVDFVVASRPFRQVFRRAALQAHRVLFVRDTGNAAFDLADAGTVVESALRSVSPSTAKKIPPDFDAHLLELRNRSFAATTLRFADQVRVLGIVLPLLALLAYAGAIGVAEDRRAAITRSGIALGAGCAALVVALLILRSAILANVYGEDELTDADVRGAIRGIFDAYLGSLTAWAIGVGTFALLVAAASASVLRPFSARAGVERVRRALHPPERPGWRVAHGAAVMAIGAFVLLRPTLAVQIVAVIVGALSLYFGAGEVLSAIKPRTHAEEHAERRRVWAAVVLGAVAVTGVAVALVVWTSGDGSKNTATAGPVKTCNGYEELCHRRLDQVTFAGAHNAMSAADTQGWLLANQRRSIPRQLRDGIRLFLIDPHYGVRDRAGKVRTDLAAEPAGLNRVGKNLTPEAQVALGRLGGQVGLGTVKSGKREVWLCHSVCELGATRMVDALRDIRRFLQRNPGEVVVIFDEDYVSERALHNAYRQSGLLPYLAELNRSEPLPTLSQLIRTDKRVIVFTERDPSGQYPWNHAGFSYIQDTPLGATKAKQFSCKLNRGEADSPLLMVNNWIDRFPPPLEANRPVLKRSFIERRLRKCARQRGHMVNLIATDFYDQGDEVDAVHKYQGLTGPPAATR